MSNEKQRNNWLKVLSNPKLLFGISLIFIIIALGAPIIFTKIPAIITFSENSGTIGDTFGMMNPFIAIAAAVITFAAFSVQYEANQEMRNDNKKQQIINRFYEMLRIHRDNVNNLEWINKIQYTKEINVKDKMVNPLTNNKVNDFEPTIEPDDKFIQKKGRQIFFYYIIEFNIAYTLFSIFHPELKTEDKIKKAYHMLYRGLHEDIFDFETLYTIKKAIKTSNDILEYNSIMKKIMEKFSFSTEEKDKAITALNSLFFHREFYALRPPFENHTGELDNYFRHLFLTVKTIAKEDDKILPKKKKRDLLRILRAQLTEAEQMLLLYNWLSGEGYKWESNATNGNHFFTQYRMIHNISPIYTTPFYVSSSGPETIKNFLDFFKDKWLVKDYCTKEDPMFEFEEWNKDYQFNYDK